MLVSLLLTCAGQRGTNKWYQNRIASLEVVVRTVREVSNTSWPTLTCTNYGEWSGTMKVKLRARWL